MRPVWPVSVEAKRWEIAGTKALGWKARWQAGLRKAEARSDRAIPLELSQYICDANCARGTWRIPIGDGTYFFSIVTVMMMEVDGVSFRRELVSCCAVWKKSGEKGGA
jgi:hypothetical protein